MKKIRRMHWRLLTVGQHFLSRLCVHKTDLSSLKVAAYSSDIQPIIASNCAQSGCHNSQNGEVFSLESYDDLLSNNNVKAGDAHGSKLYKVISNQGNVQPMPPPTLPLLSTHLIKLVNIWIKQ